MAIDYSPQVYSCAITLAASTENSNVLSFGFGATFVRVDNLTATDLWINLQNTAASTTGFSLNSCLDGRRFEYYDYGGVKRIPIGGLGLTTTSTTASGSYRVLAVG